MRAVVQPSPWLRRVFLQLGIVLLFIGNTPVHCFFGARLEPADGKVYHGAQAEVRPLSIRKHEVDWKGIEKYTRSCGHRPRLIMHYITFDPQGFRPLLGDIKKIATQNYDYIPQIGLDFYVYPGTATVLQPFDITRRIAVGEFDDQIRILAKTFVAMNVPVFIRPGYEFGGNGQGHHASKRFWVMTWRRIHDLFSQEGARKVAFVWNTLDAADYMEYYPGDNYVDWWAVNVFANDADQEPFIKAFIVEAAKHRKPVMIAESTPRYIGSVGGRTAWVRWYRPFFSLFAKYPHVKAFCYINASWRDYPDTSFAFDCRIQKNKYVATKYREMLSNPGFIHAKKKLESVAD